MHCNRPESLWAGTSLWRSWTQYGLAPICIGVNMHWRQYASAPVRVSVNLPRHQYASVPIYFGVECAGDKMLQHQCAQVLLCVRTLMPSGRYVCSPLGLAITWIGISLRYCQYKPWVGFRMQGHTTYFYARQEACTMGWVRAQFTLRVALTSAEHAQAADIQCCTTCTRKQYAMARGIPRHRRCTCLHRRQFSPIVWEASEHNMQLHRICPPSLYQPVCKTSFCKMMAGS